MQPQAFEEDLRIDNKVRSKGAQPRYDLWAGEGYTQLS